MNSPIPAGVLLLSVAGLSAYAIAAVTAEANFRIGTAAKTPREAIEKSLLIIRSDRHLLDDITKPLAPGPSKLDDDQLPERTQ
jgi:hypothetical protein